MAQPTEEDLRVARRILHQGTSYPESKAGSVGFQRFADNLIIRIARMRAEQREKDAKIAGAKAAEYRTEAKAADLIPSAFPNLWTPRARAADAIAAAIRAGDKE